MPLPHGARCTLPRPGRAVVRPCPLAEPWEGLDRTPPPPASSVVVAKLSSGSGGCSRRRAVKLGSARSYHFRSAPALCRTLGGHSSGACAAPDTLSGRWYGPRARPSPAVADPGPLLHGRLGAAPTGQAGGRWRPRTAPCAAQHREEAGQGR